jgi:flagellar L-ring protein precursor FlgH
MTYSKNRKRHSKKQKIIIFSLIGMVIAGLISGCGTAAREKPSARGAMAESVPAGSAADDAAHTQAVDETDAAFFGQMKGPPVQESSDSLWRSDSALGSLFVSQKAHHVGDIVTIKIVESSSASNQATTSTGRNSSIGLGTPQFFGAESEVPEEWLFNPLGQLNATFGSGFDGQGATKRSGDLTAYITAKITEVFPNGNLEIFGTREVTINNELQFIHLTGIIRSRDISTDNVVLSTYIADAKIEYNGAGVVDDRQKPGWLTSLLNKIWPF